MSTAVGGSSGTELAKAFLGVIADPATFQARVKELDELSAGIDEKQLALQATIEKAQGLIKDAEVGQKALAQERSAFEAEKAVEKEWVEGEQKKLANGQEDLEKGWKDAQSLAQAGKDALARASAAESALKARESDLDAAAKAEKAAMAEREREIMLAEEARKKAGQWLEELKKALDVAMSNKPAELTI